jgi:two-component system sensor histidine kinase/response regulator
MSGYILIVDDNPNNLRLLIAILQERGYQIRPANNGVRALSTAKKQKPDLILLDINMPEMDGYEVCRQLKADPDTADIPVLFISANDELHDKVKGFEVGGGRLYLQALSRGRGFWPGLRRN